jgi:RNA recognition motif. (a.k.a. RRM, RBD, or RNP domain)
MVARMLGSRPAFASAVPVGRGWLRLAAVQSVSGAMCAGPAIVAPARSRQRPAATAIVARVDRSDEGFVSCLGCGADLLVALSSFVRDGAAPVRCGECGRRWRADASDVFMLDGSANIVPAAVQPGDPAASAGIVPAVKLYVGGIGPKVTKEALTAAFEEFGEVSDVAIISDRVTGRSRGFAFVTVVNASVAEAAIAELNASSTLGGGRLTVKLATER